MIASRRSSITWCRWPIAALHSRATNAVLRIRPVTARGHDALEEELAGAGYRGGCYRHTLRTERAFGLDLIHEMLGGTNESGGHRGFKTDRCDYIDVLGEAIGIVDAGGRSTGRASFSGGRRTIWHAGRASSGRPGHAGYSLLHSDAVALPADSRRDPALETAGDAAEPKLTELDLPADVQVDPYNGEPLHLKKLPEGWLIYSVGREPERRRREGRRIDNIKTWAWDRRPTKPKQQSSHGARIQRRQEIATEITEDTEGGRIRRDDHVNDEWLFDDVFCRIAFSVSSVTSVANNRDLFGRTEAGFYEAGPGSQTPATTAVLDCGFWILVESGGK